MAPVDVGGSVDQRLQPAVGVAAVAQLVAHRVGAHHLAEVGEGAGIGHGDPACVDGDRRQPCCLGEVLEHFLELTEVKHRPNPKLSH